jgi:hypothetical protein
LLFFAVSKRDPGGIFNRFSREPSPHLLRRAPSNRPAG